MPATAKQVAFSTPAVTTAALPAATAAKKSSSCSAAGGSSASRRFSIIELADRAARLERILVFQKILEQQVQRLQQQPD